MFRDTRCDQYPPTLSVVSEVVASSGVLELLAVRSAGTERLDGGATFSISARLLDLDKR